MPEGRMPAPAPASYGVHLYPADAFRVNSGANQGDALGPIEEMCPGDVYMLEACAAPSELRVRESGSALRPTGLFLAADGPTARVGEGSAFGSPGARLSLAGRATFMDDEGERVDCLLIAIDGAVPERLALPLGPVEPRAPLTLIAAQRDPGEVRLAEIAPVAFARGTRITLACGRQQPVEALVPGDRVLTRDHGAQPVLWLSRRRYRARGRWAPVTVAAGLLGNAGPLTVSQDQRLFIYQNARPRLAKTPEILVRAGDLVNGREVTIRAGGYVDYVHLLFERHEIVYAECIPTESLLLDTRRLASLPEPLADEAAERFAGLRHAQHYGSDLSGASLAGQGPALLPPRRGGV